MKRVGFGCLALLALAGVPSLAAAAGWTVSVVGGASVPAGDFADEKKANAQTGWAIGGSGEYVWNDMWSIGVDGSWNQNSSAAEGETVAISGGSLKLDQDTFKTWQVGAHAKYFFQLGWQTPVKWYGVMGAGLYGFTESRTEITTLGASTTTRSSDTHDKRAGIQLGLGGTWWANPKVGIDGGVGYHVAFLDKDQSSASSLQYASVHAGVTFKIPAASSAND